MLIDASDLATVTRSTLDMGCGQYYIEPLRLTLTI